MAADWLKTRLDLPDDPAVIFIAAVTKLDVDAVVGKCIRFWAWANRNTRDGRLPGVNAEWLDRFVGKRGFAKAMSQTIPPWLEIGDTGLVIPRFDRHNGKSAKERAANTLRQQLSRDSRDKSPVDVTDSSRGERDNVATKARPEKRREDNHPPSPDVALSDECRAWAEAEQEVCSCRGVIVGGERIAAARKAGAKPKDILELLVIYDQRIAEWTSPAGVLANRIGRWRSGQAPADGWPDPSPGRRRFNQVDPVAEETLRNRKENDRLRAETAARRARAANEKA